MVNTLKKVEGSLSLDDIHAHWLASNYLGVAQLYLQQNALLERPLTQEDIKPRLLGHWGTVPGINLVYTHLSRLICETDANVLLITGPGHGAPGILANLFLEGTLSEYDADVPMNKMGIEHLVREFSWPYGHPSHLVPQTPGQIQEGESLGIRSLTPLELLSTIPTFSSLLWLAMEKPRQDPLLPHGTRPNFSIPPHQVLYCPSSM